MKFALIDDRDVTRLQRLSNADKDALIRDGFLSPDERWRPVGLVVFASKQDRKHRPELLSQKPVVEGEFDA